MRGELDDGHRIIGSFATFIAAREGGREGGRGAGRGGEKGGLKNARAIADPARS